MDLKMKKGKTDGFKYKKGKADGFKDEKSFEKTRWRIERLNS